MHEDFSSRRGRRFEAQGAEKGPRTWGSETRQHRPRALRAGEDDVPLAPPGGRKASDWRPPQTPYALRTQKRIGFPWQCLSSTLKSKCARTCREGRVSRLGDSLSLALGCGPQPSAPPVWVLRRRRGDDSAHGSHPRFPRFLELTRSILASVSLSRRQRGCCFSG